MSFVKEGLSGSDSHPFTTALSNRVSYKVMMLSIGGANFGGAQITQEGAARRGEFAPFSATLAVTGPSEISSCHPSLFAQCTIRAFFGEFDLPNPPKTSKRPCLSVRISPRGTVLPRNFPVSKWAFLFNPWTDRGLGSIIRLARSVTFGFLRKPGSVCASGPWN